MNDKNLTPWETEEQLNKNAAEWTAWLEWQKICSVLGCSDGNRRILSLTVFKAFEKKLAIVSRVIHDQWASDGTLSGRRDDFINEFDIGIEIKAREGDLARLRIAHGEEPRREETLTTSSPKSNRKVVIAPKDYKKLVFNRALEQPDAPLQAIRGKLLGEKGIINAIVEHFLLYTCGLSLDWMRDPVTGKRSIGFSVTSFTALEEKGVGNPSKEEDGDADSSAESGHLVGFGGLEGEFDPENGDDSFETVFSDPLDAFVTPDNRETDERALERLREEIRRLYAPKQMAIILAGLSGMPISSPALQAFCGVGHSALDKKFHALVTTARDPKSGKKTIRDIPGLSKLRNQHLGELNFRSGPVREAILDAFREGIGAAPGGAAFLSAFQQQNGEAGPDLPLAPARPET